MELLVALTLGGLLAVFVLGVLFLFSAVGAEITAFKAAKARKAAVKAKAAQQEA